LPCPGRSSSSTSCPLSLSRSTQPASRQLWSNDEARPCSSTTGREVTGAAKRATTHRALAGAVPRHASPSIKHLGLMVEEEKALPTYAMTGGRTVHDILATARRWYARIDAEQACAAMADGALLIDVRDGDQRRRDGTIPDALIIDRTIL